LLGFWVTLHITLCTMHTLAAYKAKRVANDESTCTDDS